MLSDGQYIKIQNGISKIQNVRRNEMQLESFLMSLFPFIHLFVLILMSMLNCYHFEITLLLSKDVFVCLIEITKKKIYN